MDTYIDGTVTDQNRVAVRGIEIDELKALLEGLPRGLVPQDGLATRISNLADRIEPDTWRGLPLNRVVPLCLNAIFRRTVDMDAFVLDERRVLPYLTVTIAYLYAPVQRARNITDYSLQSAIQPFSLTEIAVKMADGDFLAMVACDGDRSAAAKFRERHHHQLRDWTMEVGHQAVPMIRSDNTVARRRNTGLRNLSIALERAMEDLGVES